MQSAWQLSLLLHALTSAVCVKIPPKRRLDDANRMSRSVWTLACDDRTRGMPLLRRRAGGRAGERGRACMMAVYHNTGSATTLHESVASTKTISLLAPIGKKAPALRR